MKKPLVSVIVPCYNQAQYLGEALQSVLDQTYTNWECIIVNDGSPDNTHEVALEWLAKDARFKYIKIDNGGVSNARNVGIENAEGQFIQFLDGDDILQKNKIEQQVLFLNQNENVAIVYGSSRYFYTDNKDELFPVHYTGVIPTIDSSMEDTNQKDLLLLRNVCTICASFYRKRIFENIKFRNLIYEDWFFHIESSMNNYIFHFHNSQNSISLIRMTEDSQMITHGADREKYQDFKKHLEKLKKDLNFESKLVRGFKSKKNSEIATNISLKSIMVGLTPPLFIKIVKKLL